jgi:flagellar hook assembly protein FlgD
VGVAGLNVITWDGKNDVGKDVASGIYFYRLAAGQHSAIKKMVMLK